MHAPRTAFSLVELSIVLVILGLLTGGILAGKSLIRASELRSTSTEYQRYLAATNTFRDKYFALAGDMTNATSVWGQSTGCSGSAAAGTCNGNGDGILTIASGTNLTGEIFQFWKQLALAGIIEGNYTGLSGSGGSQNAEIGSNVPSSKLSAGGWNVQTLGVATPGNAFTLDYANAFMLGAENTSNNPATYPSIFTTEEAWNIDTKIDDGMPGTGKLVIRCLGSIVACTTASSSTDYAGTYRFTMSSRTLSLYFPRAF